MADSQTSSTSTDGDRLKVVYMAAGAAGMYCGSCLHDNTLAAALMKAGHDVLLVPTYTPLRTDEQDVSIRRMFFGGINVFLQQKLALFRHTPWIVDAIFDSPALLKMAANGGPSVAAEKLGDLTVSMLAGDEGHQRKELLKLVHWLKNEARPQVVHLSNSMFVGMAKSIRALGVPVVCTLSGEDIFLEKIPQPHYDEARRLLRQNAQYVDAFVAMNEYYANFMSDYLQVDRSRVHVIEHGLDLTGHGKPKREDRGEMQTIGYFARICPEKGLHLLVAAAEELFKDPEVPPFRLDVAGYLATLDRSYFEEIKQRVKSWQQAELFRYAGELSRSEKISFLQSLDLFSLPTVYAESKGLSVLEAMANGVPVVLPAHGSFPEMIAQTGGGRLYEPGNPQALAAELKRMLLDPAGAKALGDRGFEAVHSRFHAESMADRTANLYRRLLGREETSLPGERMPPVVEASSQAS